MSELRIRLSLASATTLDDYLHGEPVSEDKLRAAKDELGRAVARTEWKPAACTSGKAAGPQKFAKPDPKDRKVQRERQVRERWEETKRIRAECLVRADGKCECGCGAALDMDEEEGGPFSPELDHFFGRGKVRQGVRNCWILATSCHFAKTNNRPSRATWLARFRAHCYRHGYLQEERMAIDALAFEHAKHGARGQAEVFRGAR